jgi:hypothetical protein
MSPKLCPGLLLGWNSRDSSSSRISMDRCMASSCTSLLCCESFMGLKCLVSYHFVEEALPSVASQKNMA